MVLNHHLLKSDMANPLWSLSYSYVLELKTSNDFCFEEIQGCCLLWKFCCWIACATNFLPRIYYPMCGTMTLMAILPIRGSGALFGVKATCLFACSKLLAEC